MITQLIDTLTEVVPYTPNYFEDIALRNNALVTGIFPQFNTAIGQINAELSVMNGYVTSTSTAAANALAYANNAATSATAANNAALRAEAAVLDPTGTAYSTSVANWRDSMMSKAEFNAVAAERRANRTGSGFDEFGKHYTPSGTVLPINEGMFVNSAVANTLSMGRALYSVGISKTAYPVLSINGTSLIVRQINNSHSSEVIENVLTLPPAPTVLPSTATLTQQQIDSGVIKHADASNSGLIVNGKFDTDTSGWTGTNATLSVVANQLVVTGTAVSPTSQRADATQFSTIIGKKYILEYNLISNTGTVDTSVGPVIIGGTFDTNGLTYIYDNTVGRKQYIITATATSITVRLQAGNLVGVISTFDNIAVFPADAISRTDLVFLESWHEDVSEKDFVYPLGNVQYLGTTGDCGTTVAGAFAGSATYSLFSDTWQADGALVGKGYVWSTLSDANKKAFVANPENNCYLDGDKVIQVRYRMRVVMGWGDSWYNTNNAYGTTYLSYTVSAGRARAKGKQVSSSDLDVAGVPHTYVASGFSGISDYGIFRTETSYSTVSYDNYAYALPIALVHRRNQGAYHAVFNSNGTKLASDSLPWYSTTVSFASIADCFTESKLLANSGSIASGVSGRPD